MARRKPFSRNDILEIQKQIVTAQQCVLMISLLIMYDRFNASKAQIINAYGLYKAEVAQYHAWSVNDVKKAYSDFKAVAKTFKDAELRIDNGYGNCKRNVEDMITNTGAVCFYIMLRLLRTNFGANYEQLEYFIDCYNDFKETYADGEQTDIRVLAHELYEATGVDVFGDEEKK